MSTTKKVLLTVLATMALATSAFAAVPSGYDPWVNVENKVSDWRRLNYTNPLPGSGAAINIERVTRKEARLGGNEEAVKLTKNLKANYAFLNKDK